jgi:hypothetical protein
MTDATTILTLTADMPCNLCVGALIGAASFPAIPHISRKVARPLGRCTRVSVGRRCKVARFTTASKVVFVTLSSVTPRFASLLASPRAVWRP